MKRFMPGAGEPWIRTVIALLFAGCRSEKTIDFPVCSAGYG